ncbi:MAG: (E)-4-hydroxy-3-methylbut-2-enyl-diphosphate synthase [Ignavibacteria bacterium]|nr:(E)-4-hydroxy-3-methylbut-2-enyl-diphosphate synthase [Ignavibacteria bacterium]
MESEIFSGKYCNSLTLYSRYATREVNIGNVPLGGSNPIRIQSMTTADTMNTLATVEQSVRIIEAGADYVRITAPSINEANNLQNIKDGLRSRGYITPLIADIHFTPNAAETAAKIVEKVRINPGNYADRKKFNLIEYTESDYNSELERIRSKFVPLIKICKEYGTAMRIGTNHGSLSDRIMSRFGDTPLGMVESALEFVRICREFNYHEIVLSMKASNPKVMVEAYRLLINKMEEEGLNYPLHLGVTEAGEGEDGRIKSAVGIGTLLEDGIGDTVRVSLTEEPEFEIPVARNLVNRYSVLRKAHKLIPEIILNPVDPFDFKRRETHETGKSGGNNVPSVIVSADRKIYESHEGLKSLGYYYSESLDKWNIGDAASDFLYLGSKDLDYNLPGTLGKIFDFEFWKMLDTKEDSYPLFSPDEYKQSDIYSGKINFLSVTIDDISDDLLMIIKNDLKCVLILNSYNEHAMAEMRRVFIELINSEIKCPVFIRRFYERKLNIDNEILLLSASADTGGLFLDGLGDGLWIDSESSDPKILNSISFGILQATRTRISRTEYISCPSCGRTLFDLQETTASIRKRTDHLKGLKIAIMGCIVNGPGEMADADYGYVGSGFGKITLYKGREVVKKNIDAEIAVDELIELIRQNNDWTDPGV